MLCYMAQNAKVILHFVEEVHVRCFGQLSRYLIPLVFRH